MTTPALLHSFAPPAKEQFRKLVRAEGVRVYADDGNGYIDALASLWYCNVGHGRAEIIDAISAQMRELDTYSTFDPFTNGPAEAGADRIRSLSPHPDGRVFLCSSGSESVDSALKISRLVAQLRAGTAGSEGDDGSDRQIIIRRDRGYHGVNFGGTSAQGLPLNRKGWGEMVPGIEQMEGDDIESAARLFAEHGDRIAAVLTEPVQGAGGVYTPPDGYLEGLRRLCDDHGALLVFDEVISGFGRTGSWFASQTYDVTPDLITFAKGVTSGYLPLGGVICSRAVCDVLEADPDFLFRHGYTYSGHPATSTAALANIEIMEREGLVDRAVEIGARFRHGFDALVSDGVLAGYRGVGAVFAAVLPEGREATDVRDRMFDAGVILRGVGDWLALCPPLVIEDADIDRIVDVMADAAR
ncbi:MAG: aspartate aminotransferase family protein [Acidimicrobiales bacterium]|nr:MAG: aspartate aminotransferase family protein [Acidimicrobiales bacterium]